MLANRAIRSRGTILLVLKGRAFGVFLWGRWGGCGIGLMGRRIRGARGRGRGGIRDLGALGALLLLFSFSDGFDGVVVSGGTRPACGFLLKRVGRMVWVVMVC